MSGNPFFSGRIPPDLFERAEQHCDESGISKTELLITALRAYLDYPEPPKPVEVAPERVTRLEQQMNEVWRAIAQLQNQNPVSHNVSTSNTNNFPAILLNESAMARELGMTRNALRRRREKARPSHKVPENAETGQIAEEEYYFWYWGNEEPEEKKPKHLWAAHPVDNSNDN